MLQMLQHLHLAKHVLGDVVGFEGLHKFLDGHRLARQLVVCGTEDDSLLSCSSLPDSRISQILPNETRNPYPYWL